MKRNNVQKTGQKMKEDMRGCQEYKLKNGAGAMTRNLSASNTCFRKGLKVNFSKVNKSKRISDKRVSRDVGGGTLHFMVKICYLFIYLGDRINKGQAILSPENY